MIKDFRPLLALIKSVGILESYIDISNISTTDDKGIDKASDVWEIIYDSTDRKFMPDIQNTDVVYRVIKNYSKENYKKLSDYINGLVESVSKIKSVGYDSRMNLLIALSLLDDVSGYFSTGIWNGIDYKIDTLKMRYKNLRGEIL